MPDGTVIEGILAALASLSEGYPGRAVGLCLAVSADQAEPTVAALRTRLDDMGLGDLAIRTFHRPGEPRLLSVDFRREQDMVDDGAIR